MTQTDRLNSALTDRYRIERELGTGGMATVYFAEDLKHDWSSSRSPVKWSLTSRVPWVT